MKRLEIHPNKLDENETCTNIEELFCLLLAWSLWHKGAYNKTVRFMEANYPYAINNQRGARKIALVGCILRT